jgi:hypothetical protein
MEKARLSVTATITIDPDQFSKIHDWDLEHLKHIVPEILEQQMRFKSVSGIKMTLSVIVPTHLEILTAIQSAIPKAN